MQEVTFIGAFLAGIASFISPCVLPLAPPYLAYLGGTTLDQLDRDRDEIDPRVARRVVYAACCFVLGLAVVFTLFGLGSTTIGRTLAQNKDWLALGSGVLIYGFGLHFWGLRRSLIVFAVVLAALIAWAFAFGSGWRELEWSMTALILLGVVAVVFQLMGYLWKADRIPALYREARFSGPREAGSLGASFVMGMAFAFGWTPCIGPILGSILAIAAQQDSSMAGGALLAVYAFGLGVPFIVAAFFMRPFLNWARGFRRHMGKVEAGMGLVLIAMGAMMATGNFERLAFWLLDTFPVLNEFG